MPKNRDKPIDRFVPGVNYDKEFNTYVDHYNSKKGFYYTPRTQRRFTIKRNDQDLAAQSTVDYNMTGRRPKRQGGGPAQQGNINMASGGSTSGVPRPPKGEKYAAEANDWRAGEDEFAMAKEKAKKAKPPAPKPKAYAKGGSVRGDGICSKGKTKGRMV